MPTQIDLLVGKLQGDVEYLKKTSDEHTAILQQMNAKLDGVITEKRFDEHVKWGEEKVADHEARIIVLENSELADQRSFWTKLKQLLENKFANLVVNLLWLLLAGAFIAYLFSNYSFIRHPEIEDVNETIKVTKQ